MSSLFLMSTITDRRTADAFLQLYEAHGVNVTLRTVGTGTAVQETLSTLGLEKTEKAVLLAVVTAQTWQEVQRDLRRKMRIDVPGTGIAFTVPLSSIGGRRALMFLTQHQPLTLKEESTLKDTRYELLLVIANQGHTGTIMDAARAAKRVNGVKNVSLVYRRTKRYMPADAEELELAVRDGVDFKELLAPLSHENGLLCCAKVVLGSADASGRRIPITTDEIVEIPADVVISAVGESADSSVFTDNGIAVDSKGRVVVSDVLLSDAEGVYVAGDARIEIKGYVSIAVTAGDTGQQTTVADEIVGCDIASSRRSA